MRVRRRLVATMTIASWLMFAGTAHAQQAACVVTKNEGFAYPGEIEDATRAVCTELARRAQSVYALELTNSANGLVVAVWVLGTDGRPRFHAAHVGSLEEAPDAGRRIAETIAGETPSLVAPPSPPATAKPRKEHQPTTTELSAQATSGATYHSIFGIPMFSAEFMGSIGFEKKDFAVYGFVGLSRGATQYRRTAESFELGAAVEAIRSRFRIGGGLSYRTLTLESVTSSGAKSGYGPGLHTLASFDIVPFGRGHAVFIEGRGAIHAMAEAGVRLSLGFRF